MADGFNIALNELVFAIADVHSTLLKFFDSKLMEITFRACFLLSIQASLAHLHLVYLHVLLPMPYAAH